jgi:hypothetical protein
MERWLNVDIYEGRFLCQAVEFTEKYVVKLFLPSLPWVIKAVDGVDSINGLPQRSVLAPLLFSLYLFDNIPTNIPA